MRNIINVIHCAFLSFIEMCKNLWLIQDFKRRWAVTKSGSDISEIYIKIMKTIYTKSNIILTLSHSSCACPELSLRTCN